MNLEQVKGAAKAANAPRDLIGKAVQLGKKAAKAAEQYRYAHEDGLSQLHRAMAARDGVTAGQYRALFAVYEAAFDLP